MHYRTILSILSIGRIHVDALSRAVNYVNAVRFERELELKQLKDMHLQTIARKLEFSDSDKFQLIDGLVYKKDTTVPDSWFPNRW